MNLQESPLFVDLLKKLLSETKRATTDKSASVETSPLKDLFASLEKSGFANLDFGKLLGSILSGGSGSGLGGLLGSIGSISKALGVGAPSAEETKAACASVLSDISAAGEKLSSLNPAELTPERSRLADILGKTIDFVKTQIA